MAVSVTRPLSVRVYAPLSRLCAMNPRIAMDCIARADMPIAAWSMRVSAQKFPPFHPHSPRSGVNNNTVPDQISNGDRPWLFWVISNRGPRRHGPMHVRFAPKADKQQIVSVCPVCAMSRHDPGGYPKRVCRAPAEHDAEGSTNAAANWGGLGSAHFGFGFLAASRFSARLASSS